MSALVDRARRLAGADPFVRSLGIAVVAAAEGRVEVGREVGPEHLNFLGGGHGGLIFTLADTAFGLASNIGGTVSIGIDTHMAYIRGVRAGDQLSAVAEEISRSSKTAVYRVDVRRDGEAVAAFTGTVHVTGRSVDDVVGPDQAP